MQPIHEVKRPMYRVTVYKSHVEIIDRTGCAGIIFPRNTSIPIRNISGVDITPITETFVIKTADGRSYKYSVGGLGGTAKGVRDAIYEAMQ